MYFTDSHPSVAILCSIKFWKYRYLRVNSFRTCPFGACLAPGADLCLETGRYRDVSGRDGWIVIAESRCGGGQRGKREREGREEGWTTVDARGKGKLNEQTGHLPLAT